MEWLQVFTLFLANASLIVWFRSESRADWRHMDNKVEEMRKEFRDFRELWMDESKDFHERLCQIEANRNK